eukprot:SAG11_NODE_1839_length_4184_cov_4.075398_5_plen_68_part_00
MMGHKMAGDQAATFEQIAAGSQAPDDLYKLVSGLAIGPKPDPPGPDKRSIQTANPCSKPSQVLLCRV